MLQNQYDALDTAEKLGLFDVCQSATLYELLAKEIKAVKEELCRLSPSPSLTLEYAIIQQRLLSLEDLEDFLKRVRKDITPQPEPE